MTVITQIDQLDASAPLESDPLIEGPGHIRDLKRVLQSTFINFGANVLDYTKIEYAIGNPPADGYILSSTAAGVRSWIAPSTGMSGDAILSATQTFTGVNTFSNVNNIYAIDPSGFAQLAATDLIAMMAEIDGILNTGLYGSVTVHSDVSDAGSGQIITVAERNKLAGIAPGAEVNVPTNLGVILDPVDVTVTSSTGSNAVIPAATNVEAGAFPAVDKIKLDGIISTGSGNIITAAERTRHNEMSLDLNSDTNWNAAVEPALPLIVSNMTATRQTNGDVRYDYISGSFGRARLLDGERRIIAGDQFPIRGPEVGIYGKGPFDSGAVTFPPTDGARFMFVFTANPVPPSIPGGTPYEVGVGFKRGGVNPGDWTFYLGYFTNNAFEDFHVGVTGNVLAADIEGAARKQICVTAHMSSETEATVRLYIGGTPGRYQGQSAVAEFTFTVNANNDPRLFVQSVVRAYNGLANKDVSVTLLYKPEIPYYNVKPVADQRTLAGAKAADYQVVSGTAAVATAVWQTRNTLTIPAYYPTGDYEVLWDGTFTVANNDRAAGFRMLVNGVASSQEEWILAPRDVTRAKPLFSRVILVSHTNGINTVVEGQFNAFFADTTVTVYTSKIIAKRIL